MFKYKVPSANVPFLKPQICKNHDYTTTIYDVNIS